MGLEDDLTDALFESYQRTGKEVGYWAHRFRRALLKNGGLATAQRMLKPRTAGQRQGLDALLAAGKPELTMEAVILRPMFKGLFTPEQLKVAQARLGEFGKKAAEWKHERLFPDELTPGKDYAEGARKQVRVNAYERNPAARKACIDHYGSRCLVCDISFEERYGELGKDFIHVHHLNQLALVNSKHKIDPITDLRPVCPNCHAMLHRVEPPLSIEALKKRMAP